MPAETPVWTIPYPLPDDALVDYPALGQDLADTIETRLSWLNDSAVRNRDPLYAIRWDGVLLSGGYGGTGPSLSVPVTGPYLIQFHFSTDNGVTGQRAGVMHYPSNTLLADVPLPDQGQFGEGHNNAVDWAFAAYLTAGDSFQVVGLAGYGTSYASYRYIAATYGVVTQGLALDREGGVAVTVEDPTELPGGPNYAGPPLPVIEGIPPVTPRGVDLSAGGKPA